MDVMQANHIDMSINPVVRKLGPLRLRSNHGDSFKVEESEYQGVDKMVLLISAVFIV